LAQAYSSE